MNVFRPRVSKTLKLIAITIIVIIFGNSCVKEKNCTCDVNSYTGLFVYLNKQFEHSNGYRVDNINSVFFPNINNITEINIDSIQCLDFNTIYIQDDGYGTIVPLFYITGNIPKKFRNNYGIVVNIKLEGVSNKGKNRVSIEPYAIPHYTLKCIEKIE